VSALKIFTYKALWWSTRVILFTLLNFLLFLLSLSWHLFAGYRPDFWLSERCGVNCEYVSTGYYWQSWHTSGWDVHCVFGFRLNQGRCAYIILAFYVFCTQIASQLHDCRLFSCIGNESVPIQLTQCRFPAGAGHFQRQNINIFFKQNIRKQFYQTALGNCYSLKLPKCRLQFKKKLLCHLL